MNRAHPENGAHRLWKEQKKQQPLPLPFSQGYSLKPAPLPPVISNVKHRVRRVRILLQIRSLNLLALFLPEGNGSYFIDKVDVVATTMSVLLQVAPIRAENV